MKINPSAAVALVAVAIGSWFYYDMQRTQAQQADARRAQRAEQQVEHPREPQARAWPTAEGTFIVIEHATPMIPGGTIMEVRRCYVWRDAATSTSSMSCEPTPDIDTSTR